MSRLETLTAIDLGTSKVVCIMAELHSDGELELVARGICPCVGMKRGSVSDLKETVSALETALERAEKSAGYAAGPALVALSGEALHSQSSRGVWPVGNAEEVTPADVERVLQTAGMVGVPSYQEIVHVVPRSFTVDGCGGVRDPVGLSGLRLEASAHVVAASYHYLENIRKCLHKAGLELLPEGQVAASIASSLAVLTEEERELGTAMADFGLGTIDFAVYAEGEVGYSAVLPTGGEILLHDLAHVLHIPVREAERLMLEMGAASPDYVEDEPDREMEAARASGEGMVAVPRRRLAEILEARLEETLLKQIGEQVAQARKSGLMVTSLVMTGGCSQLPGLARLAHRCLNLPTRVAAPCYPPALPQNLASPIYSTAVGLLLYAATRRARPAAAAENGSRLGRLVKRIATYLAQVF